MYPCLLSLTFSISLRRTRDGCVQVDVLLPFERVLEYVYTFFCACVKTGSSYSTEFDRQEFPYFVQNIRDAVLIVLGEMCCGGVAERVK